MSLIALLVEGKTEKIFFNRLLPFIQLSDKLFVSRNLIKVINNEIHENRIWLKDCQGDGSFTSYMKKNVNAFVKNHFDKIILIRDYYPENLPSTNLCKRDLSSKLFENFPSTIVSKYSDNIFINLSVQEIEAWFFADKRLFERMSSTLTEAYINDHYDNILTINPEEINHPSSKLKKIINTEIPNHNYNKTEDELYYVISRLDINTCISVMSEHRVQSLNRIVNYLMNVL